MFQLFLESESSRETHTLINKDPSDLPRDEKEKNYMDILPEATTINHQCQLPPAREMTNHATNLQILLAINSINHQLTVLTRVFAL